MIGLPLNGLLAPLALVLLIAPISSYFLSLVELSGDLNDRFWNSPGLDSLRGLNVSLIICGCLACLSVRVRGERDPSKCRLLFEPEYTLRHGFSGLTLYDGWNTPTR